MSMDREEMLALADLIDRDPEWFMSDTFDDKYLAAALRAASARCDAPSDALRHAFRAADAIDWQHLDQFIPHSGHGQFWRAVFKEVRAALSAAKPAKSSPPAATIGDTMGHRAGGEASAAQHFDLKGKPAQFVRNGILETCQCFDCRALTQPSASRERPHPCPQEASEFWCVYPRCDCSISSTHHEREA